MNEISFLLGWIIASIAASVIVLAIAIQKYIDITEEKENEKR